MNLITHRSRIALFMAALFFFCPLAIAQDKGDTVTLYASQTYVSRDLKDQNFEGGLPLQPGQEKLPLTLTVLNGVGKAPGFKWFRLNIAGYLMASEKDLDGGNKAVVDVTGKMHPGTSQIIMEAGGVPGATLSWTLTTKAVRLNSLRPASAMCGEPVVISGKNFSSDESQDIVSFNSKVAPVLSASATSITVLVPEDADPGVNRVMVSVDGLTSGELAINCGAKPLPELLSLNYWMVPPGAELTISGRNFAIPPSDNKVFFNDVQAEIVSGDQNTLVVTVPNWSYGPQQLNIPVSVIAGGVRSSNSLPVDIGPAFHGALPEMPSLGH